jgi:aquaporin Z
MSESIDKNNARYLKYRKRFFFAEFAGTALLLLGGLSLVIFMFGAGSAAAELIPNVKVRQAITGFLFGCIGAAIAISPIGKVSGAHVNPAVTVGFWLLGKLEGRLAITYVSGQLAGAVVGCIPLLLWGDMGRSLNFGGTTPGVAYTVPEALLGEVLTTFALMFMLMVFIAFRELRPFTPFMVPFLYGVMVPLEADVSGISTNPARSFGPAVVSGVWDAWWIYWIGPLIGVVLASAVGYRLARRVAIAKLYHFDAQLESDELLKRA